MDALTPTFKTLPNSILDSPSQPLRAETSLRALGDQWEQKQSRQGRSRISRITVDWQQKRAPAESTAAVFMGLKPTTSPSSSLVTRSGDATWALDRLF